MSYGIAWFSPKLGSNFGNTGGREEFYNYA